MKHVSKVLFLILLVSMMLSISACESSIQGETDKEFPEGPALVGDLVQIESGTIQGDDLGDLVRFRGIPYAAPPVGPLRFRSPEPHPDWTGTLNTTTFGPECPQYKGFGIAGEEDCLSLNIWAPKTNTPLPVMFFIHGGGFIFGSSQNEVFDGAKLARNENVIVITINYRLGILGFLTSEALQNESLDGSVGNYGIRDQILALEWVQSNITFFGGDPGQVTIFGESAGGISICALLGIPSADGLYGKAIIQSGGGCVDFFEEPDVAPAGRPSTLARHADMIASVGCANVSNELDCLRDPSLSAQDLVSVTLDQQFIVNIDIFPHHNLEFSAVVDGVFLPQKPLIRIAQGQSPDIPIMLGNNSDESAPFLFEEFVPTRGVFRAIVSDALDDDILTDQVLDLYPSSQFFFAKKAYEALVSDFRYICPDETLSQVLADNGGQVYNYHFTHVPFGGLGVLGAVHGLEQIFVFENFPALHFPSFFDITVSRVMQRAWGGFARTGRPQRASFFSPSWPEFSTQNPKFYELDSSPQVRSQIRSGRCEELRNLGLLPSL